MPPFVVTLGMMSIARSLAMVLSGNQMVYQFGVDHEKLVSIGGGSTGGWFRTFAELAGPDTGLGSAFVTLSNIINIPNPAIFLAVLALIFGFAFRWTKWGRHIFAIGGNEHAARLTGVPVRQIKVSVYMLSALMAGIAGILLVGWLGTITTGMGAGIELVVIAAVVIGGANLAGGAGTAFGAVVGRRADRDDPQQPDPPRHQPVLARHLHRQLHHHRRAVRPDPRLPPSPVAQPLAVVDADCRQARSMLIL